MFTTNKPRGKTLSSGILTGHLLACPQAGSGPQDVYACGAYVNFFLTFWCICHVFLECNYVYYLCSVSVQSAAIYREEILLWKYSETHLVLTKSRQLTLALARAQSKHVSRLAPHLIYGNKPSAHLWLNKLSLTAQYVLIYLLSIW